MYDILYMWNQKENDTNELIHKKRKKKKRTHSQNRNRLTENKLRVARSWGGRMRRRDS